MLSEHLLLIIRHLENGGELPDDLRHWLVESLRRVLHGCPASMAFHIDPGYRRQERDRLLRLAVANIEGGPWRKAEWLARQVDLMRQGRRADPIVKAADEVYRLPTTQRHLYRLLTSETL